MRMKPETAAKIRVGELAQIHIAKKQLGWSEDEYRTAVRTASGGKTDSAGELTFQQRYALLGMLKKCGFKVQPKAKKPVTLDPKDQSRLIRHLWLELHAIGAVREREESALMAYVKRQTGKEALAFLNVREAQAVIESLKQWLLRVQQAQAKAQQHNTGG